MTDIDINYCRSDQEVHWVSQQRRPPRGIETQAWLWKLGRKKTVRRERAGILVWGIGRIKVQRRQSASLIWEKNEEVKLAGEDRFITEKNGNLDGKGPLEFLTKEF